MASAPSNRARDDNDEDSMPAYFEASKETIEQKLLKLIEKLRKSADEYDEQVEICERNKSPENANYFRAGSAVRNEDADLLEGILADKASGS